ncbi:MAG TPA: flagellar motor switch protein FliM [Anaerolinea thermolimosa]|uniref:Flagellar motor switch protein FliM n=1 Tax=Anaerolinea thermolimosa TaxID=229919 RepID=A0A3D1JDK2_9CHLR|nr:flagellar motor switch protein FliM [Anaerolinea thermolimosa]GAP07918.1 flagellar motor switch protein FliM [Anaerolinea thermolimosa]HCE16265.1 flagellar motor switch protein FliM [Anaerolinea thermolimosa]
MLSQSEIDALLAGAIELDQKDGSETVNLAELINQTGAPKPEETKGKKITAYNFWSPDRFSKEQMRAVELVHEDLTERLTTSLPTFLRTTARPRLVHTEQGRFHDFIKDFPPNSLFHMLNLAPLPGQMVITLSPNISIMILEQRLGGKIEGASTERPLTEIDQSLLRGLVEHMIGDIKAAWSKVVNVEPTLEDSTTNQHWVQMVMGNERVMLLTFELQIQGVTGTMSMFIPFTTLKPIANVLNPHIWIAGRKSLQVDPSARQAAMASVSRVMLPIRVILGNASLSLREVVELQVGDVIQLDTGLRDQLVVLVSGKKQFTGKVGRSGNHLAVQVTGVIRDSSESQQED